jgi:general stress protein 26
MGIATATIEMQSPEEHRERLHDLLKATRTVMVLSCGSSDRGAQIVGRPMVLLRTGDDTTMYVAASLDAQQRAELTRDPRIAVAVQGSCCALFDAEVMILRDRKLLDGVAAEWWMPWGGRDDPSIAILVISPIEGAYWEGPHRYSYQYRLAPARAQRELSDGVPVKI